MKFASEIGQFARIYRSQNFTLICFLFVPIENQVEEEEEEQRVKKQTTNNKKRNNGTDFVRPPLLRTPLPYPLGRVTVELEQSSDQLVRDSAVTR